MSLKILHTADWHVGASRNIPNYLERQADALRELVERAKGLNPDVVCITGDLFDSNTPREEERCLIVNTITEMLVGLPKATVIVVGGNHDWNKQNDSMLESIDISYKIAGTRFKAVYLKPKLLKVKGSYFMCIPCQQDLTKSAVESMVSKMYEEHVTEDADYYVCMHECFQSYNDLGKQVGKESLPDLPYVKYWMLGDIHKHQWLMKNAWYSGSLLQVNFGESENKGFVFVSEHGPEFIRVTSPKRLVTVEQGEEVPEDALVKYRITDLASANKCELPTNVVAFAADIKAANVDTSLISDDITDGLAELVAEKFGYDSEMQKKCVDYVRELSK